MTTAVGKPNRLAALFSVMPGEGHLTLLMLAYAFCAGIVCTFFYTAAYALFLARFDAAMLPYVYIGSGVVAGVCGIIYTKLEHAISASRLLVSATVALLISNLAFFLVLRLTGSKWVVFAAIVWYDVLFTFVEVTFWGLATQMYNVRQGKRLFGLIGSGEQLAGTIGGLSVPLVVAVIGTTNLFLVAFIAFVFCLVVVLAIVRKYGERLDGAGEEDDDGDPSGAAEGGTGTGLKRFFKERYPVLIIVSTVVSLFAFFFLDMAFYDGARTQYPGEKDLARFLGVFNGVVQAASLFILPLLSGRLLNRYGLKFGLLLLPVAICGGAVLLSGTATALGIGAVFFWLLVVTKLLDSVTRISIYFPATQLLYQPLPSGKRTAVQTMVESIITPVGGALAGGILLIVAYSESVTTVHVLYALVAVVAGLTFISAILSKDYGRALMEALGSRFLKGAGLSLTDASSLKILRERLSSPHAGEAIYCLDMLENMEHESVGTFLTDALAHPAPAVREHAIRRLRELGVSAALPALKERAGSDNSPKVRAEAIEAVCSLGEFEDVEEEARYVDDPDPMVRRGALVGLMQSGSIEAMLTAGRMLLELERSAAPADRELAAGVLAGIGSSSFYSPLLGLLNDDDFRVRNAALRAAGKVRHARLWPLALENLAVPECHRAASAALAEGGDAVVEVLRPAFFAPGQTKAMLSRIARVCGKIGAPQATRLLEENMAHPDKDVALRVLKSLAVRQYTASHTETTAVTETIQRAITDGEWALKVASALPADGDGCLLRSALLREVDEDAERIFLLLTFLHDAEAVTNARVKLERGTVDERAYAFEMLDTLLPQELKSVLFPLLQARSGLQSPGQAPGSGVGVDLAGRVRDVLTQRDVWLKPWTRACALHAAAELPCGDMVDLIVPALSDPDPLVRETAAWALAVQNRDAYREHAPPLRQDPAPEVRAVVKAIDTTELGDAKMLLNIEKVLVLKSVSIFGEIPDDVLAQVANVLKEVDFNAGDAVFEQGEVGSCMYIIVDGQVRIHDGDHTVAVLGPREVFGDMAVLDSEPRSASATVQEDSKLLQLGQKVFYELMSDHVAIVRGISRLLSQRLRERVENVEEDAQGLM